MTGDRINGWLDEAVRRIAERFRPEMIILFGSRARDQAGSDSDPDLLVVIETEGACRQRANDIDRLLGDRTIPMDIIVVTRRQFERQKHVVGTIAREAFRRGRVLYDRAA